MHLSLDAHAQAVRDRQQALRADADAHRLVLRTQRRPFGHRVRCLGVRLRVPAVSRRGCGSPSAAAG